MKKVTSLILATVVLLVIWFLFGRGLLLQTQVALTPAKVIEEFACSNNYSFQVKEDQNIVHGSIDTPYQTHINIFRDINLVRAGKVLATIHPAAIVNFAYGNEFPAGESFLQTYVFDKKAITPGIDNKTTWRVLKVPSSEVSLQDFKGVAQCLHDTETALLASVDQRNSNGSAMQGLDPASAKSKIGWIMLVDSSVKREPSSNAPEFNCTDGRKIVALGDFIQYRDPFGVIGLLAPDGTIYRPNGPGVDVSQPTVSLPDVQCTNSRGESLKEYIKSIPNRISVLNN